MSVLVTGASGLVGSHVVEALVARGDAVRALVRPASRAAVLRLGADAVVGDVTDPAAWRAAARGVRAIVHAAAIVQRRASWEQYVAVNVEATRLAVAAARAERARLVHISSVAVYAGSAAYPATPERRDEDFPFQPIAAPDFYARSKRMAEDVVRDAATERDRFPGRLWVTRSASSPFAGWRGRRCPSSRARTPTSTIGSAPSSAGGRRPRPERRSGAPSPGFSQTKSPGASPGHRICPVWLLATPGAFSWRWAWRPVWRPGPSSSPYRPSSCGTCRPSSYATYRTSSSWTCRPASASSVARPFDTRPW